MDGKRDVVLIIATVLTMLGAFNWLLITLFKWNVVEYVFGSSATSAVTKAVYILVGLAAIYMLVPLYHMVVSPAPKVVKP